MYLFVVQWPCQEYFSRVEQTSRNRETEKKSHIEGKSPRSCLFLLHVSCEESDKSQ